MLPDKEIVLEFEGEEFIGKFPKTGQLLDIQAYKSKLLQGQLGDILRSDTTDGFYVSVLADMIAHFTYVFPTMIEKLGVKSFLELESFDTSKLMKLYTTVYQPWYKEWSIILWSGGDSVEKKDSENSSKKEPLIS